MSTHDQQRPPGGQVPAANSPPDDAVARIAEAVEQLTYGQARMESLLDAVRAISRELELPVTLERIVTAAMELTRSRYGALGLLDEDRTRLAAFIPLGLTDRERADLAEVELPHGRGLLGHLVHYPEPLRVDAISRHPQSVGFPEGHPSMRTLLGVAIRVRGRLFGNIYLCDRLDGLPFDAHDEAVLVALAGAAGVAIENARLYEKVRSSAEEFQRLLLPRLPDLHPFEVAAAYRPATAPHHLGGDWYDALLLPDGSCTVVIGDVMGHDLQAAATMAQTCSMLRALLYDRGASPGDTLGRLDRTLSALTAAVATTVCVVRIEPGNGSWTLRWSTAGHVPPLVVPATGRARYLNAEPGIPLGVDADQDRPDHRCALPADATLVLFTDGLVEHPRHSLDEGLDALAALAAAHARDPLDRLCQALADGHPSDAHDDMAVLAVRAPGHRVPSPPG